MTRYNKRLQYLEQIESGAVREYIEQQYNECGRVVEAARLGIGVEEVKNGNGFAVLVDKELKIHSVPVGGNRQTMTASVVTEAKNYKISL